MIVTIRPGSGTAISGPDIALLIAAPPGHRLVDLVAGAVLAGERPAKVLDRWGGGLDRLPAFAIVDRTGAGVHLLLREGIVATAVRADRSETIDAAGHLTWVEVNFPGDTQLSLRLPDHDEQGQGPITSLPLGLLPAGGLDVAPHSVSTDSAASIARPADAGDPADAPVDTAPGELRASMTTDAAAPPVDHLDYEHLFEGTVFRPTPTDPQGVDGVPAAPTPPFDASPPGEPDGQIHPLTPETSVFIDQHDDLDPGTSALPDPEAPVTGLIDSVPGMDGWSAAPAPGSESSSPPGSATTEPASPAAPARDLAPTSNMQHHDPSLEPETTARGAAPATLGRPMVGVVRCPASHPNPTHADTCRSCGASITDRTITTIPRPALGRLRFSDGQVVELHRNLAIGRSPSADLQVNGEATERITVPAPDNVVSRTHLLVHLDGWQVRVTDRDSRNHTFLDIPGRPRFQLRPGEPYPIPIGCTVWLGDEASFTYEA